MRHHTKYSLPAWAPHLLLLLLTCLGLFAFAHPCQAAISDRQFYIEYPTGEDSLAESTLATLRGMGTELEGRLPLGGEPVRVLICGSVAEFRLAAGRHNVRDISGLSMSSDSIILLKAPHLLGNPGDFLSIARHELVHVALERNSDTGVMPDWMNEGLAMSLSKENRWWSRMRVGEMYVTGKLIRYKDLDLEIRSPSSGASFSDAYAQAHLMTLFLMDHMGEDAFWKMVTSFREMSFGDALRAHAGWSPLDFDEAWRSSLWYVALVWALLTGFGVFQAGAFLVLAGYLRQKQRRRKVMDQWEKDEAGEYEEEVEGEIVVPASSITRIALFPMRAVRRRWRSRRFWRARPWG